MMKRAKVFVNGKEAGILAETEFAKKYRFEYLEGYSGSPVSLTMPMSQKRFEYNSFPPFFEGVLPEGYQLDGLLNICKIDRNDFFSQLMAVGKDLVGNVTVEEVFE
jgi:serine/threonine-protein kinase HipA